MCDSGHDSSGPLSKFSVAHFLLERKTEEAAVSYVKIENISEDTH